MKTVDQSFNMKTSSGPELENDDLICPITFDVFRDPVIANDGHVYERTAITQWILRRGTSPITRQPLRVEELQSDDYLRRLSAKRRNSPISYSIPLEEIPASTIRPIPPIITQASLTQFDLAVINNERNNFDRDQRFTPVSSIIAIIIIVLIMVPTVYIGSKYTESGTHSPPLYATQKYRLPTFEPIKKYSQSWSYALTTYSEKFYSKESGGIHYFKRICIRVSSNKYYTLQSNSTIDLQGYLYNNSFTGNFSENLLESNSNDNGEKFYVGYRFRIGEKYTLVVTTKYPNTTGLFTIGATSIFTPVDIWLS